MPSVIGDDWYTARASLCTCGAKEIIPFGMREVPLGQSSTRRASDKVCVGRNFAVAAAATYVVASVGLAYRRIGSRQCGTQCTFGERRLRAAAHPCPARFGGNMAARQRQRALPSESDHQIIGQDVVALESDRRMRPVADHGESLVAYDLQPKETTYELQAVVVQRDEAIPNANRSKW
ncbi:hypothetical protein EK21DRAFT_85897 [Setomelanomma holmii]|uniref:Uncharacterized protein n=1 Tax=Setomelanomma holmii TaxID=210430 RepID=A0A9P4HIB9_9PLEO|nr:hypothetical protein EK21DRAFT_85897 [Setomelanomma holmii]